MDHARNLRFEAVPLDHHGALRAARRLGVKELHGHTLPERGVLGLDHLAHRPAPESRKRK